VQEVPGSNPGGPTKYLRDLQLADVSKTAAWSPTGVQKLGYAISGAAPWPLTPSSWKL